MLQRFCDYTELEARLVGQGPESRSRFSAYQGKSNLSVPMPYRLALLLAPSRLRATVMRPLGLTSIRKVALAPSARRKEHRIAWCRLPGVTR